MIIAQYRKWQFVIRIIGILALLSGGYVTVKLFVFAGQYAINLWALIAAVCMFGYALYLIVFIISINRFSIDNNYVRILSVFGKVKNEFPLTAIHSWMLSVKTNKNSSILIIYGDDFKYKFYSRYIKNLYEIAGELTAKAKYSDEELEKEKTKHARALLNVFFMATGSIFLLWGLANGNKKTIVSPNELTTVYGTLAANPDIVYDSHYQSEYLKFKLKEYPDFEFRLDSWLIGVRMIDSFKHNVHQNDSVRMDIDNETYRKKFSHEYPLSFFDRINYKTIFPIGLRTNQLVYLSNHDYNIQSVNTNRETSTTLIIIGFFDIGVGIFFFFIKKENQIK